MKQFFRNLMNNGELEPKLFVKTGSIMLGKT